MICCATAAWPLTGFNALLIRVRRSSMYMFTDSRSVSLLCEAYIHRTPVGPHRMQLSVLDAKIRNHISQLSTSSAIFKWNVKAILCCAQTTVCIQNQNTHAPTPARSSQCECNKRPNRLQGFAGHWWPKQLLSFLVCFLAPSAEKGFYSLAFEWCHLSIKIRSILKRKYHFFWIAIPWNKFYVAENPKSTQELHG